MNGPADNTLLAPGDTAALIYIVDDETILSEMAAVVLRAHGYRVQTFTTAEDALAAFAAAQPRPCLVITDYSMLQMTGLKLIAECRRMDPAQKAILVSGTQAERVYRDVPCKPDRFLAKPFRAQELITAVEALVGAPKPV
jgi:DNA-binding NtrC family response regulator